MDIREQNINIIQQRFSYLKTRIEFANSLNLTDVDIHAENFFRDLFNILGYSLRNVNLDKQNSEYIDLIDDNKKTAIQVTAQNDSGKISKSIEGFYRKPKYKDYSLKVLLISKTAKDYRTDFSQSGKYQFDAENDIIDINKLLAQIANERTTKIIEIKEFLEKEISIQGNIEESEILDSNYDRFSVEYIGRDDDVKYVLEFLNDPEPKERFLLLYGVGGMGKSHLLSECRKKVIGQTPIHEEGNLNYDLEKLFEICNIPYPEINDVNEIQKYFLDKFCHRDLTLILDDFYEIADSNIRELLPKFVKISGGKILLVSRTIPKQLTQTGLHVNSYELPSLEKKDFNTVLRNYIIRKKINVTVTDEGLNKIYLKAQGYPLGGQLIVDLLDLEEELDDILDNLPKFQAERDPEGKDFSNRLLDNIFKKESKKEIDLLCEFSAFFESSSIKAVKQLPSYDFNAFETLVRRRRFIQKEAAGTFHCHAMIRDFAYAKLSDNKTVHNIIGEYYENILIQSPSLDSEILSKIVKHYSKVDFRKLKSFGIRVNKKFHTADVKSLIENNIWNTIRNYISLLVIHPENVAYYNELGIAYRLNDQIQFAINTFKKGLEYDPKNVPSYNELGITYRENDQKQLAIDTFLKGLEIAPENVPTLNELGITYRENHQEQLAIDTFLKGLKIKAEDVLFLNELGITYRVNKQNQLAIDTFKKVIEDIDPKHVPSYNELGITYKLMGQYQLAIDTFIKVIEDIDPKNVHSYNALGITYRVNKQNQLAIDTFKKVINDIDSKHVQSYNELGITYKLKGQYQLAIDTFKKVIDDIDPKNVHFLNELGITYKLKGQYQLAIDTFKKVIEDIDPKNVHSYNALGITYRVKGQYQLAIDTFKKVIEDIDPKNVPSYNELGITYRENGQFDKAIDICKKGLTINPNNGGPLFNLFIIYLFFKTDSSKANEYSQKINFKSGSKASQKNKKMLLAMLLNIDAILNLESEDEAFYNKYLYYAIFYKAYHSVIPLLFKLIEKFPNSAKMKSRLGRTLTNQTIGRHEEAREYLLEAIKLFDSPNQKAEHIKHIFYYLGSFLNDGKLDLIENEILKFEGIISALSDYFRFLGRYYIQLDKPAEEIIEVLDEAIKISQSDAEKVPSISILLEYLASSNPEKYSLRIKELVEDLRVIDQSKNID